MEHIPFSERMGMDVSPQQRIEDMIRVTELCIDLLKENEEHHGEVSTSMFYLIKFTIRPILYKEILNWVLHIQVHI